MGFHNLQNVLKNVNRQNSEEAAAKMPEKKWLISLVAFPFFRQALVVVVTVAVASGANALCCAVLVCFRAKVV